jgi:hypothetical protein
LFPFTPLIASLRENETGAALRTDMKSNNPKMRPQIGPIIVFGSSPMQLEKRVKDSRGPGAEDVYIFAC